jgi:hypothetical protein
MNAFVKRSLYSAFTDKVENNCHFTASGWNCMTHRQASQCFPDKSQGPQVSIKTKKSTNLFFSSSCREQAVVFNFYQ